jgi:hypothetical protein
VLDHPTIKGERMKKHYGFMLFFVGLVSIGWTVCSQAMELIPVTSFGSTWAIKPVIGTGTGTVTTDGAKVNLSFQGGATGNGEIDFYETTLTGLIGMWATLRVDQVTTGSNGDCSIGICQNVGKIGNSRIQLAIFLEQWTNLNRVVFRVRASDLTTNVILRTGIICAFHKLPLPAGEGWGGGSRT